MAEEIEDILLREKIEEPFATKGSGMTNLEIDANTLILAKALIALNNPGAVSAYSAIKTYNTGSYVLYDSKLYRAIADSIFDITPGTNPAKWVRASVGELAHVAGADSKLMDGDFDVSAADLRQLLLNELTSMKTFRQIIAPASVKTLFSSPYILVPTPGEGKGIDLRSCNCIYAWEDSPASTAYATSADLTIKTGSLSAQASIASILGQTSFKHGKFTPQFGTNSIQEDADLVLTSGADPTLGDVTIIIYGTYVEVSTATE